MSQGTISRTDERGSRASLGKRIDQQARGERLMQECDAAGLHGLSVQSFVVDPGHEDDRKLRTLVQEPPPQFDAGHAAQLNVEDETGGAADGHAAEERFGGCEALRFKAGYCEQAR